MNNKLPNLEENPVHFTAREKEILQLTVQEYTGTEIAHKLYISPKTVNAHKTNLIRKTGAKNFIGVIAYAISYRIISVEANHT